MAGDWIKMRCDLFTHPKVVRISSAFEADTLRTVGGLMSVWSLFDAHSVDGILEGYSGETLDNYLRWPGFSAAMVAVGWLIQNSGSIELPRFFAHNGQSAKRRAQDADRKKEVRKMSSLEEDKKRTREEKRREDKKKIKKEKISDDFQISERVERWANEKGFSDLEKHFEHFVGCCKAKGYEYADWDEAFMGAIRKNWAGIEIASNEKPWDR